MFRLKTPLVDVIKPIVDCYIFASIKYLNTIHIQNNIDLEIGIECRYRITIFIYDYGGVFIDLAARGMNVAELNMRQINKMLLFCLVQLIYSLLSSGKPMISISNTVF